MTKTPLLAAVERKGIIKAGKSGSIDSKAIGKFITNNVVFGSNLMTDEYRIYQSVQWIYKHGNKEYVSGEAHTIEWIFFLLNRSIVGIYPFVGAQHLDNYLNEASFRYNSNFYTEENRFNLLLSRCDNKRLTYKSLVANA